VLRPDPDSEPDGGAASGPGESGPGSQFRQAEGEFYSESRDGSWASKTESLIVTIGQRFPETRATDVECRARNCRVTLTFPGVEAYNAMFRGLAEDKELAQSGMVANIDGSEATVYIRRAQ
jgi:hypothetical protein